MDALESTPPKALIRLCGTSLVSAPRPRHLYPAMPSAALTRSTPPARRRVLRLLLTALALAPLALALLALDTAPRVADPGPPDALAAAHTRDVAAGLKALVDTEAAAGGWSVSETEINAVLRAAQRLVPGLVAAADVDPDRLHLAASLPARLPVAGLWLNLDLAVAPSEAGLRIASARLGRLPLPPDLALRAATLALDRRLGDRLASRALAGIAAVRLAPPVLDVALDFPADERAALFAELRARALAATGTAARERVYHHLYHLHRFARRGRLPRDGSVLPYLREAVRFAARPSDAPDREEMRAALYALALYCGDPGFGASIAVTLDAGMQGRRNGCDGTTLGGRDDLKRHFVLSAGLHAATSGQAAFGLGELKELLDSNPGGTGFSFDDIAVDLAGLRFADALLAAPRGDWPAMLEEVAAEADLVPAVEDLPSQLGEAEFRARYGDVDSPEYAALVGELQRRIDALPLHAPAD
jgi:hypothetical protein